MNTEKRDEYISRNRIMRFLSDEEASRVSTAETSARLPHGAEYIDLEHLERGVQRALGSVQPMGSVLPKHSVSTETWKKILTQVPAHPKAAE